MSGRRLSCLAMLTLTVVASPSSVVAQTSAGVAGYFAAGSVFLAAGESFEAVSGSRRALSLGGGAMVKGVWRGLFVDVGVSRQKIDGQRVFVSNGSVFPLGIPWQATFVPVDLAAGWSWSGGAVSPYVGGGATLVSYRERSDFAQSGDDVSERKAGPVILAGIDVPLGPWIRVGGEVRYRWVSDVLGAGGVSDVFDEDQLGGVSTAVRVSVGR